MILSDRNLVHRNLVQRNLLHRKSHLERMVEPVARAVDLPKKAAEVISAVKIPKAGVAAAGGLAGLAGVSAAMTSFRRRGEGVDGNSD